MLYKWNKIKKWHKLVEITAGLLVIVTTLINLSIGVPFRSLMRWWAHELVLIQSDETFKIETTQTVRGIALNPPDRFSYVRDIPLEIRGTTKLPVSSHIWVILEDQSGGYYLQTPAVEIKQNSEWHSYNIRPLSDIKQIIWLFVDDVGDEFFGRKAKAGEWGKFMDLPESSRKLAYVLLR